jgi:hypothetical protein
MRLVRPLLSLAGLTFAIGLAMGAAPARAQAPDTLIRERPFVPGGYDDKPHLTGLFGRIRIGGYLEGAGVWEREDGATEELGVELTRMNVLTSTDLRGRVQVWGEIEFEEGGEEIVLELAQVDLLLHRSVNLRGGILLLPLGRFNLAHDGPRNQLPRRPALATELIGSALSQPGLGAFGRFERASGARFTYEAYGVTGFDAGILENSAAGTRLTEGRLNREDSNASPAWTGRIEWSSGPRLAIGAAGFSGAYNLYRLDGLDVDERRDVRIGVGDLELEWLGTRLAGEGAVIEVDVPSSLAGIFASRQSGAYAEASRPFGRGWIAAMPEAHFTAVVRADVVDFDRDLRGDSLRGVTFGVNLRPIPESCFKLAFTRGENRDRFNNRATNASWALGFATYF